MDFGCGIGRLSKALSHNFESVVGVVISSEMIRKASARCSEPNIEFLQNDVDHLRILPDDHFDFVLSVLVLQHIPPKYAKSRIMKFEMSALAIALDECEPILAPYRRRYTKDGAKGMMAHITILYPFCGSEAWNDATTQALSATVSAFQPFRLTFNRLGRFPESGLLYLEPSPGDVIVSLIRRVSETFPDFPLYEGAIPLERIKPHATIAASLPVPDLDAVESEFAESALPLLPRNLLVKDLWFFVKSNEKWRKHSRFGLGEADAGPGVTGNTTLDLEHN